MNISQCYLEIEMEGKRTKGVDEESETVEEITSFSFKRRIGKEGIQSKKRGGNGRKEEKREEREVKLQSTSIHVTNASTYRYIREFTNISIR